MKLTPHTVEKALPETSWFRRYLEVLPLAEPPKTYLLLGAMSIMGASLGRRVWFGQDFRKLWPMLNLLLIGPSGIGKSTSIELAQGLLNVVPKIERPQFILGTTPEKLHADLLPNPHAILFASELANFFNRQDYMSGMVPYVTELLDYKRVEKRTKSGGVVAIEQPSVTVIGGSTVEWLQGQLPDAAVSGGFLARFFILSERDKGQKIADPESALSPRELARLHEDRAVVFEEFYRCLRSVEGKMGFEDLEALDAYTVWYSSHEPDTGHLSPFAARAGEFIKRLAMISAASRMAQLIGVEDIECALSLYEYTFKKLQDVVVPMSQEGKMLDLVLQAIGTQSMSDVEIKRAMKNFALSQNVDKFLLSLLQSRDLVLEDGKFRRVKQ